SRELSEIPDARGRTSLLRVHDTRTATLWAKLFHSAFGYQIHASVVEATMHAVDYFIGSSQGGYVGTAALYLTGDTIAGIHSMGVIPEQRRKGYAEDFLLQVMHAAKNMGADYATLQASEMGKGLYLKTGFQEDFLLRNFIQITKTENK
ncbi:MAG: GNAT family N-acetyltransferase, partial [Cyclobacteriaceae bacterium]